MTFFSSFHLSEDNKKKFNVVKEKFDGYFIPKRNYIFERARFNQRKQLPEESVDNFITDLHTISEFCDYGEMTNQLIRDRIVVGIRDVKLSEKLQLDPDLTLEKAVTLVRQSEAIKKQQPIIRGEAESINPANLDAVKSRRHKVTPKIQFPRAQASFQNPNKCSRCGKSPNHNRNSCPALWALFNRRNKRFKELQKCFNARRNPKVKESLVTFLNEAITLPKRKNDTTVFDVTSTNDASFKPTTSTDYNVVERLSNCTSTMNYESLLKQNKQLVKVSAKKSSILKSQTSTLLKVKGQNKHLKDQLKDKTGKLKSVGHNTLMQIQNLQKKNSTMANKAKELKSLKIKSTVQEKQIKKMKTEIDKLSGELTEMIDTLEQKENIKLQAEEKLNSVKKLLKSTKKKVQRRNQNITGLQNKLKVACEKYETDKEAIELYYNGIVENLKYKNKLSTEMQVQTLEEMRKLETKSGGKYKGEVRLLYYDLLTKGVSANTVQSEVRTVLENMTEYDMSKIELPGRSTAQRMVSEAGELVKIRTSYELARQKTLLCHQSDGTTKNLIHWGAHAVKLLPNDDPTNPKFFTLTLSPGKADDTVKQLQDQFTELGEIANKLGLDIDETTNKLGLDIDETTFSVTRIGSRMSDRAANEKRVSKILTEMKDELNMDDKLYTFTCGAHQINNMASAMTDASAKKLYEIENKSRGMYGAKKHIYECNKLLCEHARKEYGLGVDFKAYSLCTDQNTGSDLFRPIVGNRYLIFLQNAIPTISAKDIVLMFLEDVRDAKENPGLNRLEFSVQQGYLNSTIITEEISFALMYYYVCSPLMQKVKSVKSPLDMNHFYEATIDKLQKLSDDPTGLMTGNDLLWENATGPQVYQPYMMEIYKKSADNTLLFDTLKVMAKAGKQKLKEHAIEHLTGGQYAEPTPEMEVVANTVGEATNDRIESMFGMLDRQMKLAPSSNPVNVSSLISAKQDKPIQWLKNSNLPVEKVCNIAMTQAAQKRKKEGTRVEQIKRRYLESKAEREAKIAKRRKMRQERKQRLDENLKEAKLKLCRSGNNVKKMLKNYISYQVKLWRAVGTQQEVVSLDSLKIFSKLSSDQQVISLQRVIRLNKELIVQTVYEWDTSDDEIILPNRAQKRLFQGEDSDWSSSDEKTLDMERALASICKL